MVTVGVGRVGWHGALLLALGAGCEQGSDDAPVPVAVSGASSTVGGVSGGAGASLGGSPAQSAGTTFGGSQAQPAGASSGGATSAGGVGGGGAGGGLGGSSGRAAVPECVAQLFRPNSGRCSGPVCHDQGQNSAAKLDLASPGVEARLIGQPALHYDVAPGSVCGAGDKLIDPESPRQSWLLKKLSADQWGTCGSRMPIGSQLTATEVTCLESWVDSL